MSGEVAFYEELFRALRKGAPLDITLESVRRVMWVIERCREHHRRFRGRSKLDPELQQERAPP